MPEHKLAAGKLEERRDLQRWIIEHPELVAPDLLLITTEFGRWESRGKNVDHRLDVLFLDRSGALVVAELKRDKATDTVELQALKYAAYCAQLTLEDLAEIMHEDTQHGDKQISLEEARERLVGYAPGLDEDGPTSIKIRLVAGSFGPAVTSVVLWLREYGIDIGCVELSMRKVVDSREAVIAARQLLPLPQAEDYLVRRRRKERAEDQARKRKEWTWDDYEALFDELKIEIARRLFDLVGQYVVEHELPWEPNLAARWLGYMRPGNYYVPVIRFSGKAVQFGVRIPDAPERLGLCDPYSQLAVSWHEPWREWMWEVPSLEDIPDIHLALDIARGLQPDSGPMPTPVGQPHGV